MAASVLSNAVSDLIAERPWYLLEIHDLQPEWLGRFAEEFLGMLVPLELKILETVALEVFYRKCFLKIFSKFTENSACAGVHFS